MGSCEMCDIHHLHKYLSMRNQKIFIILIELLDCRSKFSKTQKRKMCGEEDLTSCHMLACLHKMKPTGPNSSGSSMW